MHYPHTPATPISIQLAFLRRTGTGPAVLTVEDSKLGARTSTIHVSLLQTSEKTGKLEVKVTGYVTVSPESAEVGISARTNWVLEPAVSGGSGVDGAVDLEALGRTGRDGAWERVQAPFLEFRKATRHLEMFSPLRKQTSGDGKPPVIDQWARFRSGGDPNGRWTNEALVYLADMFPGALQGFDRMAASAQGSTGSELDGKFWYPTVTLNIDLKKRLPAEGEEWLYSRVVSKAMRNGRMDIEVVVMDTRGEVVAVGGQVGLVLSASRNVGQRQKL